MCLNVRNTLGKRELKRSAFNQPDKYPSCRFLVIGIWLHLSKRLDCFELLPINIFFINNLWVFSKCSKWMNITIKRINFSTNWGKTTPKTIVSFLEMCLMHYMKKDWFVFASWSFSTSIWGNKEAHSIPIHRQMRDGRGSTPSPWNKKKSTPMDPLETQP